jgi:hypothetical protein
MKKFVRYVTLSNSSKICCMAKGAKTFTTMDSNFVRPHELLLVQSSCHWGCTIHGSKRTAVFYSVECKQSFFGCNMFTLIGCSFFGKIRRYFFYWKLVSAATACLFFLLRCGISERPACSTENCDLQMEHSIFHTCWSSFKNGYSASELSVTTHFLLGIFMVFYP